MEKRINNYYYKFWNIDIKYIAHLNSLFIRIMEFFLILVKCNIMKKFDICKIIFLL